MGLYKNIDVDFAKRTLRIIEQYDLTKQRGRENFEVTLLVNCLVGLLVLPHERRMKLIPDIALEELGEWSIDPEFVTSWGPVKNEKQNTLRELVHRLRNSVAHFRIEAEGTEDDIERLKFSDRNGFEAVVPVHNLKAFVKKFAQTISDA